MTAKQFAMKRNGAKWRLKGVQAILTNLLNDPVIVEGEKIMLELALVKVEVTVASWDRNYLEAKRRMLGNKG